MFFDSDRAAGLCCRLMGSCRRGMPKLADLSVKTKDVWEIPRESLQLIKKLGNGQFGEVWMGRNHTNWGVLKGKMKGNKHSYIMRCILIICSNVKKLSYEDHFKAVQLPLSSSVTPVPLHAKPFHSFPSPPFFFSLSVFLLHPSLRYSRWFMLLLD